jgi:TATA-binding protein-associated factor Taf7
MKGITEIQCPTCRNWHDTTELSEEEFNTNNYECHICGSTIAPSVDSLLTAIIAELDNGMEEKSRLLVDRLRHMLRNNEIDDIDYLAKELIMAITGVYR